MMRSLLVCNAARPPAAAACCVPHCTHPAFFNSPGVTCSRGDVGYFATNPMRQNAPRGHATCPRRRYFVIIQAHNELFCLKGGGRDRSRHRFTVLNPLRMRAFKHGCQGYVTGIFSAHRRFLDPMKSALSLYSRIDGG